MRFSVKLALIMGNLDLAGAAICAPRAALLVLCFGNLALRSTIHNIDQRRRTLRNSRWRCVPGATLDRESQGPLDANPSLGPQHLQAHPGS